MLFPDIVEQLAHEIPRARLLVHDMNESHAKVRARRVAAEGSLLSMLCHLSKIGMEYFSVAGIFSPRLTTRPLTRIEAEHVLQLISDLNALLPAVDRRRPIRGPGSRDPLSTSAEVMQMIKQIEKQWGRYRGPALLYIPYYIESSTRYSGYRDIFSANAEVTYPGGGGCTVTGLAGQNSEPNTPEVAVRNFMEALSRLVARTGVPLQALPFRPSGPAAGFRVEVP